MLMMHYARALTLQKGYGRLEDASVDAGAWQVGYASQAHDTCLLVIMDAGSALALVALACE